MTKSVNPCTDRKMKRQAMRLGAENTFDAIYKKCLAHRSLTLEEGRHSTLAQIRRAFAKDVLPFVRGFSIHEITRIHLLEVIGRIEARKSPCRFADPTSAWTLRRGVASVTFS